MFEKIYRENENKHFMFNNFFFVNRAFYEIMPKNTAQPDWPQMTTWRMRITCWIPKVINTYLEYVILIAFPLHQQLHESTSVFSYAYIACQRSL